MKRIVAFLLLAVASSAPSQSLPNVSFTSLTAGDRFTCGLTANGQGYCWGANYLGQLGIGKSVGRCDRSIFAKGECARAPVVVAGGNRFIAIAAGDSHACGIDDQGAVYCWGENHFGELGSAIASERCTRESSRDEPTLALSCSRTPVRVPLDVPAASIAAGERITCVVDTSGQAWCWGVTSPATPVAVPVDQRLVNIAAGGDYVCALTAGTGIRCWSWPEVIQKGVSTPTDETNWTAVTVGTRHACALDTDGRAFCWGSDADGALGTGGSTHNKYDEVPMTPVLGSRAFVTIHTGVVQTCATEAGGALYCWGRVDESSGNDRCLDSNGIWRTNACTTRPVLVQRQKRFRTVAIGSSHQCGITMSGETLCWGANEAGQLGNGMLRSTPVATDVRTGGISPAQIRLLDVRERLGVVFARGGFALLVLIGLWFAARRWMASLTIADLIVLGVGSLILTGIVRQFGLRVDHPGLRSLLSAASLQPVMIAAGLALFRLSGHMGAWWAAGDNAAVASGQRQAGRGALVLVLIGWLVSGSTLSSIRSSGATGDVAGGLAMMALLTAAGATLVLSAIAAAWATVTLRGNRHAIVARVALVLASLTLLAGTVGAFVMFWPRER